MSEAVSELARMAPQARPVLSTGTLLRNTGFNVVGRLFTMLCSFLLTPVTLSYLGAEAFGLWAIAYALILTAYMTDLGMVVALQKSSAACYVEGREARIPRLTAMAIGVPVAFWSVVALGLALVRGPVIGLLGLPAALIGTAETVLWATPLLLGLSAAMWCLDASISGMRRMDITNIVRIAIAGANVGGTLLVLNAGLSIEGLLLVNGGANLLACIALGVAMRRLIGASVRARVARESERWRDSFRELMGLGFRVQGTNLLLLASAQMDKLVLTGVVGLAAVTYYELGSRLLGVAQSVPLMLISAIPPAAAEIWARGDHASLSKLYVRGSRWLSAVYIPMFVFLIALAPSITTLWVGPGYEGSAGATRLLAIGGALIMITGMGTTIGRGIGIPEYETAYVAVETLTRLPLSIVMGALWGLEGVLWANVITSALGMAVFMVLFHRRLKLPLRSLVMPVLGRPLVASAVSAGALLLAAQVVPLAPTVGSRLDIIPWLVVDGVVFVGIYAAVLAALGHFTAEERTMLVARLKRTQPR